MDELFTRFLSDLASRASGPFAFRFVLQPLMATFYAYRDGARDAHAGRPPYLRMMFTHPDQRRTLLRDGLASISRVIGLGIVMDLLYQAIVLRGIRPLELIVIVLVLAVVPYLLIRGPVNRLLRSRIHASNH